MPQGEEEEEAAEAATVAAIILQPKTLEELFELFLLRDFMKKYEVLKS